MHRCLSIRNFRNIGVSAEQQLDLNPSFNENKGGLVILIGHNNVGKTNYLKALEKMSFADDRTKIDKTNDTTSLNRKNPAPQIKLQVYNQKFVDDTGDRSLIYEYEPLDENGHYTSFNVGPELKGKDWQRDELDYVSGLVDVITKNANFTAELKKDKKLFMAYEFFRLQKNNKFLSYNIVKKMHDICSKDQNFVRNENAIALTSMSDPMSKIKENHPISAFDRVEEMIGTNIFPKVFNLSVDENAFISSKDSSFTMNFKDCEAPIVPNFFFAKLFKIIGYDYQELVNAYKSAKDLDSKGDYEDEERKINSLLEEKFINQINNAFQTKDENGKYSVSVHCESTALFFEIKYNSRTIRFSQSSEGFRWFFTFYLNLYGHDEKFEKGDIILLDDPCLRLHDTGIVESCNLLRKFAEDNEVTIMITTHRSAFINLDYLEETRVVVKKNNEAIVKPLFNVSDKGENDDKNSLKFILDALSTSRNTLVDTNIQHVIYCEGQTDYYYLTGYKKYLENIGEPTHDLYFSMLNGIDSSTDLVEKVKEYDKLPFFFIDGDKQGQDFYKANCQDGEIQILRLNSIKEKCTEIEDIFSQQMNGNYHVSHKTYPVAVRVKRLIANNKLDEETMNNLKDVYDALVKCVDSLHPHLDSDEPMLKKPDSDNKDSSDKTTQK